MGMLQALMRAGLVSKETGSALEQEKKQQEAKAAQENMERLAVPKPKRENGPEASE